MCVSAQFQHSLNSPESKVVILCVMELLAELVRDVLDFMEVGEMPRSLRFISCGEARNSGQSSDRS